MKIGPDVYIVREAGGDEAIAVAGNVTVYSEAFHLRGGEYFAGAFFATSDGVVALTIQLEQSWEKPAIEGAAEDGTTAGDYQIPENMADVIVLANEEQHYKALTPVALPYGRFKIAGSVSNAASTLLYIRLSKQEEI